MRRLMVRGLCLAVCAQAAMVAGLHTDGLAYESGTVKDGAVVRGTVSFKGTAPAPKVFEMRRYPDQVFCGALSDGAGHRSE